MSISEQERHELSLAARQRLGEQQGNTLMAMLPPTSWADVTTKHDLAELARRMDLRFESLEDRLSASIERTIRVWATALFIGLGGLLVALGGVVVAT